MTTFFTESAIDRGELALDENAALHARVLRLAPGDAVSATDGRGLVGVGAVSTLEKKRLVISITRTDQVAPPPAIHLYLPVADRDRMLWLAEKSTELQVATWTPVMYERSKSVTPRGEGAGFEKKLRARMVAALEQSGSAWLPRINETLTVSGLAACKTPDRFVFERGAEPVAASRIRGAVAMAIGPEGGFAPIELSELKAAGWRTAALGAVTLRFETAAVAAVAIARAALDLNNGV
jgi:16S rRNA (uracil1498-N3)-methyltransferase